MDNIEPLRLDDLGLPGQGVYVPIISNRAPPASHRDFQYASRVFPRMNRFTRPSHVKSRRYALVPKKRSGE
jgi:hypothetical protein